MGMTDNANRATLEKTLAKILQRHCNFGWAHYYIPSERFPSLIQELVEAIGPSGQVGHQELVEFFLRTQRLSSAQQKAEKFEEQFTICRRG